MKYNMTAAVFGMVFSKMLKGYYKEHFKEIDINSVVKDVKKEYKAMVKRTPDIGKKNGLKSNLIGACYFFAMGKKVPNMTPELMNKIVDETYTSDFMIKMHAKKRKSGYLFKDKVQEKKVQDAKRSQESNYEFDWKYEYVKGKDEFFYTYTKCGVCKLAKQENMLDYLPCMCHMDYGKFEIQGAKLIRTQTLANGDPICDFHLVRIKEK